MRIYVNGNFVPAEILPIESQTLDETLDALSLSFVNSREGVYAPMQSVEIEDDDGTSEHFVLSADSVEPFTLGMGKFRHNFTLVESTRKFTKRTVRNSVFSQPENPYRIGHNLLSCTTTRRTREEPAGELPGPWYYQWSFTQFNLSLYGRQRPLQLRYREKCAKAYFTIRAQFAVMQPGSLFQTATCDSDCKTLQDVKDLVSSPSVIDTDFDLELVATKNGVTTTMDLTSGDLGGGEFLFNTELECPKIARYLNEGYSVFVRPKTAYMMTGRMYYEQTSHIPFYSLDFRIRAEIYYNTAYDVLDLLLKRMAKEHKVQGGDTVSEDAPFVLPQTGELADSLKNAIAPNFVFTQATLYECVAEVFRLFDAIFTLDGDNVLGITYFNDRNGKKVVPSIIGKTESLGEERRVDGLISYYQDARLEKSFPSKTTFATARSSDIGVPAADDRVFMVDSPIDLVSKAEMPVTFSIRYRANDQGAGEFDNSFEVVGYVLDISDYVVERTVWSGYLDTTATVQTANPTRVVQNNSVYYSRGDDKIQIGYTYSDSWGINWYAFGQMMNCALWASLGWYDVSSSTDSKVTRPSSDSPDWSWVRMRVEYLTTVNGRLKLQSIDKKCDGDMIVDQSNGAVDLGKLGLNIFGLSLRMGEPSLMVNVKPFKWANRIKKGDLYEYQGSTWVANVCSYVCLGNGWYKGSVQFVKDYNELSLRKSIVREKRLSNISSELTVKSEDDLTEYLYYSSSEDEILSIGSQETIWTYAGIYGSLAISFGADYEGLETLPYVYLEEEDEDPIYVPTIRYGAGNSINFEMGFKEPMSAGIQTKAEQTGWFSQRYVSSYVLYTDSQGFRDEFTLKLATNAKADFTEDFPIVPPAQYVDAFEITSLKVYKQPNEVFALNYSIALMPISKDVDFLGRAFVEDNFLVKGVREKRKLVLYYSISETYSILDQKGKGDVVEITSVDFWDVESGYLSLEIKHGDATASASWAVCDEDGNILFASNRPNGTSTWKWLYFKLRRDRIE